MVLENEETAKPTARRPENSDDFFGNQDGDLETERERQSREVESLRRRHFTAGLREGANEARENHVQGGFDKGFLQGAKNAALPAYLLGACEMVSMFLHKNRVTPNTSASTQRIGDTEIPTRDVSDLISSASHLRKELQPDKLNKVIDIEDVKNLCRRVVILDKLEKRLSEEVEREEDR